uniref:18 kDa Sin3-associated polypeptide n=1 Tax=Amphimedon queenslandica TaxID=400682 RepID=A0A1X7UYS5_AMPQE
MAASEVHEVKKDAPLEGEEEKKQEVEPYTVDREKTCPFLLRVFCNEGRHHRLDSFMRGNVPSNELQIYTCCSKTGPKMDCTLRELMSLVKEVNPDTRQKGTLFSFATVYPDNRRYSTSNCN